MLPLNQIVLGDCLEVMRGLPDGCVDSVVTDPPYGLGKVKNLPALIQAWLSGEDGTAHQTSGFMGKDWDVVPSPNVWREVYRVLKPGGYALVFAGTRTVDLMGLSLRLAGFEISESVNWVFGQGFPKSKKMLKPAHEPILFCYKPGKRENLNIDECRIQSVGIEPNARQSKTIKGKKPGTNTIELGVVGTGNGWNGSSGRYPSNVILSHSPDCVACGTKRVKGSHDTTGVWGSKQGTFNFLSGLKGSTKETPGQTSYTAPDGTETIAAYTCVDGCPVRLLDEQTAQMRASKPSGNKPDYQYPSDTKGKILGSGTGIGAKKGMAMNAPQDGDGTANASRFFLNLPPEVPFVYQPKASRKDRTMNGKVNNTHVTVKPTQLMAYLCKLVTPVDGVCLDPFAGSGSTALGCIQEGRQFIGIERDPGYHAIAQQRIATAQNYAE